MLKFLLFFLGLTIINGAAVSLIGVEFGTVSYWQRHGLFLLFFLGIFPRLTLLISSIPFGGLYWWLGWVFAPRYLIAILATINYWETNPILVTFSWLIATGGECTEKMYIKRRVKVVRRRHLDDGEVIDVESRSL